MIEEDLDQLLALRAHEQRVSKAAIIRQLVRDALEPGEVSPTADDPFWEMYGVDAVEPDDDIDDVIYR
jgi:hypothetical protein